MNVLEKILEEIKEATFQEDAPIYMGDMEVDGYVRASRIEEIIRSHMDDGSKSDWIPCSERLPEKPVFGEDSYIVQTNNIITPFSAFWDGEEWTDVSDDKVKGVIAWQPLPKRYKGK
ncbi:DUF551 domain-containing protein [Blautia hansenii]|uniref:DUF551 domain-containing protein n=1 Tax=Blautia hansenii DSM 20583 TaxID=537007 RepID=C9L7U4_BLAHA|nr:DUF551 domain-containing protein [Blautia hansenii]ASM69751.1 DUF551 domain-containing protein [Blautia hansenii DSM 20583]EEX21839.1 hypothetical protein BLAHAN_05464 [Blautia hansenii DSM 20583]UWO09502.1 DUF551 domain-containing protein [Blautia hansenii DSM 20583]